jgi:hypothetical protein
MTARQTLTRDDGSFSFDGLPAGQYTLSSSRLSYLNAEHGATRPGGTGSAIVLSAGQKVADIVLRLFKFGGISGVIYDQDGVPAAGISVEALRYTMRTGRRTLSSVYGQPAFTDDRGVYRIGGLAPGEYFVAAGPSPDRGPADVQRLVAADIDRVLQSINQPGNSAPAMTFAEPRQVFAPVYFPDVTEFAGAQRITLGLSEERPGIDIRLQLVTAARIHGTVIQPNGETLSGVSVSATPMTEAQSMDLFSGRGLDRVSVDEKGRFTFSSVAPGRYSVVAQYSGALKTFAVAEVAVNGTDQNVSLVLQPTNSVSGVLAFDGKDVAVPASLAGAWIRMGDALGTGPTPSAATVNPNRTFIVEGVPPGQYRFTATAPAAPSGWFPRSAMLNGIDLLDAPLAVSGRDVDGIVITYTDRPTELSGTLQTPAGVPTGDYFIIVFATDRGFWTPSTRRSVMARPASTGKYILRNLPPGEYFVAAVTDVEQGEWFDSAFLERLIAASARITLAESEKRTLDLRIAGGF